MDFFYIHPDDRKRLLNWGRCHLVGCAAISAILLSFSFAAGPLQKQKLLRSESDAKVNQRPLSLQDALAPVQDKTIFPQVHQPVGWRRTVNGWEHTSNWLATDRSIDDWILAQQTREPAWLQRLFDQIRRLSPLTIASGQIAVIALVIALTRKPSRPPRPAGE